MWKPHENHVGPMWKPHENHVGDMCKPCANHVQTIWKPHENHVETTWKPCGGSVSCWSQIPNPKTKPGLPDEIWLACQYVVIKECHLQGGHCLLHKCTFSPAWFACFCLNSCKSCQYLLSSCTWDGWMDAMDRIDWMETTLKPCGAHVETTWKPCGGHVQTMGKPCANHLETRWKHVETTWKPCGGHVQTMCKRCGSHVETTWKPCGEAVSWWSQIPNPKTKPGLPDEIGQACQHMVIKECHLQWGHYLLHKCVLNLQNLHVFA